MRLVAFSEKPLCLIKVLTATMRADGVSPGLDEAKGYRSAIARTIHLSGGADFGSDEFLSLMFKKVCIERPKQRLDELLSKLFVIAVHKLKPYILFI
jgi:hypothetical protein